MDITHRKATLQDIDIITKLGLLLYSDDNTFETLYEENLSHLGRPEEVTFLAFLGDIAIGMAQSSVRRDYVEGTDSGNSDSKVGYLEGIFVRPEHRSKGIAKALIVECENWARQMGCKEFASDCRLQNEESYHFHLKIGFTEVGRNIHFAKDLGAVTK